MNSHYVESPASDKQEGLIGSKIRSYNEVVEFLNTRRVVDYNELAQKRMQQLNTIFGDISSKIDIILVGGCNGKSLTINFAAKLLNEEKFKVGIAYASHFLTFNERILIDSEMINNKHFTEYANEVIAIVEQHKIDATAFEIVIMAALLFFKQENVNVALLEVGIGGRLDATSILAPKICVVTQIAEDNADILGNDLDKITYEMTGIASKGTWFISAEQSKIRLQKMKDRIESMGVNWVMPVRKLASLPYIYEQLYGKNASLAERITQIYVEDIRGKFSPFLRGNILTTLRGQRGRPTLEAKRQAELNPVKTLKSFWYEEFNLKHGCFELLDKDKPTVLLDSAHNIDALINLFLGVRLLHYQRPLKGFALILGLKDYVNVDEVVKHMRYLFKRVNGQAFFVELKGDANCLNPNNFAAVAKSMNLKVKECDSFNEAYNLASKAVDERHGLLCITGHSSLITEYWKEKGIKKFN